MTTHAWHEACELLDAYAEGVVTTDPLGNTNTHVSREDVAPAMVAALHDILGLHLPGVGGRCGQCHQDYPCVTVRAITERLGSPCAPTGPQ